MCARGSVLIDKLMEGQPMMTAERLYLIRLVQQDREVDSLMREVVDYEL